MRVKFVAVLLVLLTSACVQNTLKTEKPFTFEEPRILLVRPDVTLAELSAGGVPTVKADWTEMARTHIRDALLETLQNDGATVLLTDSYNDDSPLSPEEVQLEKLHSAVGKSIRAFQVNQATRLPTKEVFDWSLGPGVKWYRDQYDADFVLLVHIEDSYSSGGRRAAQVMAAVLFGVALPGGIQQGFASLVDLRDGEVVWFNQLFRDTGDLRELEPARETIDALLLGFPGRPMPEPPPAPQNS